MENREIENFYTRDDVKIFNTVYENPEYNQNTMPLKHPFRALLIAQTGGGKTNLLLDIINKCKCFQLIKLFVLNREEPIYEYLTSVLDSNLQIYEGIDSINEHLQNEQNHSEKTQMLYVFDDLVSFSDKQHSQIKKMFIRCRKLANGISCCYLSQSFYSIPKIIRQQVSYIFVRKIIGNRDLSMILRDTTSGEVTREMLNNMYNYCTSGNDITNFLYIDLSAPDEQRFRKNYSEILNPQQFSEQGRLKRYGNFKLSLGYDDNDSDEY